MSAMEKVAWTELSTTMLAVVVVALFLPWLGAGAAGFFGLLALGALGALFLRGWGERVVVDERDREIGRRATSLGVGTAWMTLLVALIAATLWANHSQAGGVSTVFLNWLIWSQFALCYAVKGIAAIAMYRGRRHAA